MKLTVARPAQRPPLTGLADRLDRFLLPLVLISAALGVSLPGPGRRADAAGAILVTLAVLVFCTGASMTFSEIGAIRTAARRLAVVLPVTTIGLPVLAWLASHLVNGVALRGGILSAGIAPAEVASVALTGLAGGEAALAAGLLAISTVLTVLLAGPILGIAGAHSSASQLGLLSTLALVVALPLIAGSAMRSLDPFGGREQPITRVAGTASLLVLLWEVASQLHLRASDARVLLALLAYLAGRAAVRLQRLVRAHRDGRPQPAPRTAPVQLIMRRVSAPSAPGRFDVRLSWSRG